MSRKPHPERKPPCPGCRAHGLGYIEFHIDAERREKRGEKQARCPVCGLWCWASQLKRRKETTA